MWPRGWAGSVLWQLDIIYIIGTRGFLWKTRGRTAILPARSDVTRQTTRTRNPVPPQHARFGREHARFGREHGRFGRGHVWLPARRTPSSRVRLRRQRSLRRATPGSVIEPRGSAPDSRREDLPAQVHTWACWPSPLLPPSALHPGRCGAKVTSWSYPYRRTENAPSNPEKELEGARSTEDSRTRSELQAGVTSDLRLLS